MKKIFLLLGFFGGLTCSGQTMRKVSVFFDLHTDVTIYDRTRTNNMLGFGSGLHIFLNTRSKFSPNLETSCDVFGGTKELHVTEDGRPIYAKDVVGNVLAGLTYRMSTQTYLSIATGPSFFNSKAYLTIKPSFVARFPQNQRFIYKFAYTHVFQHDGISSQGFGYLSFSLGVRLF